LAEAAHAAEKELNQEAQWLKSMGRSALPRGLKDSQTCSKGWAQKVKDAMTQPLNERMVTVSNGTTLSRRDFDTVLEQPYWLNDEVIAAYIQLSIDKALEQTGHTRGKIL
jgi:Ulp1 family protease